jgi:hypothetical protein
MDEEEKKEAERYERQILFEAKMRELDENEVTIKNEIR